MERDTKKSHIAVMIACVAVVFACIMFAGCSSSPALRFAYDELSLFVGDERDMALYATFDPATADERGFGLESSNACVEVRGTKIKAVSPGTAEITASNGSHSATVTVKVEYRPAQSIAIETDGNAVQTVGKTEPITFNAYLDDYSDPDIEISWSVNGEPKGTGGEYTFEPNGVGEFEISAAAAGLSATENVAVYSPTEAAGHSSGALEQYRDFSAVRFYVEEQKDNQNPLSVYRWTVNGETASTAPELEFVPLSLGVYEVELYVNGVKRDIDDGESAIIVASGDRAPSGRVEFDDMGGVFVVWNDGAAARSVSITGNGDRRVYNSSDSRYAHLFGNGRFDASDYISPCSAVPRTFTVAVAADAFGEPFEFTQYPQEAQKYIEERVLCGNSFLTGESSVQEWIRELYAVGRSKADGYLSREAAADGSAIKAAVKEAAERLGLNATAEIDGSILSVDLGEYVNAPTFIDSVTTVSECITPPHFEMIGSGELRTSNYRLYIERAENSVVVSETEQLLIAVGLGIKPEPEAGTPAAAAFSRAQAILMSIIGRDYTDAQKVHAIYDWLQLCTRRVANAKPESVSNFLEGVFGDGKTSPALVVSDAGAAKTVALLCGMEGIACDIAFDGGNYYNRVEIGGLRYNVDVYDGEISLGGNTEYATHAGLFFADGKPSAAHSAYDTSLWYYLQKRTDGGVYYDRYIEATDTDESIVAAVTGEISRQSRANLNVKLPEGSLLHPSSYYGAELVFSDSLSEKERAAAKALIEKAVADHIERLLRAEYKGENLEQRIAYYVGTINVNDVNGVVRVAAQIPVLL